MIAVGVVVLKEQPWTSLFQQSSVTVGLQRDEQFTQHKNKQ